jgi:hypothetical protein
MNDKIATLNAAPVSTPSKDAPASPQVAQPLKVEDNKQPVIDPVTKPAVKS